jgi:hypothetical protein
MVIYFEVVPEINRLLYSTLFFPPRARAPISNKCYEKNVEIIKKNEPLPIIDVAENCGQDKGGSCVLYIGKKKTIFLRFSASASLNRPRRNCNDK